MLDVIPYLVRLGTYETVYSADRWNFPNNNKQVKTVQLAHQCSVDKRAV